MAMDPTPSDSRALPLHPLSCPSISDGDFTILDHIPGDESLSPTQPPLIDPESQNLDPSPLMAQSQYSQVLFHDVPTWYPLDQDLSVSFSLNDETLDWQTGGWIGLFRLTHSRADQAVLKMPVSTDPPQFRVVFRAQDLPRDPQYYQFQFFQWTGQCVGASLAFHLGPLPVENQSETEKEPNTESKEVSQEPSPESVQSLKSLSQAGVEELNRDRMAELERSLAFYQKKCQVLEKEAEFIKSERDMGRVIEANLQAQNQETEAALSRAKMKIEELVSMLTALTQSKQMAMDEIITLTNEKKQTQAELRDLKETLSQREAKVESLQDCILSLGQRHENLEMEKEALEKNMEHIKYLAEAKEKEMERELFEVKEQLACMNVRKSSQESGLLKTAPVNETQPKTPTSKIEELEQLVKDLQIGLRESAEMHAHELKALRDDFHELRSLTSYSPSVASSTNFMDASMIEKTLFGASDSKEEVGQTEEQKKQSHLDKTIDMLMDKMYSDGLISTKSEPVETDVQNILQPETVNKETATLDGSDLAELMKWAEQQDEPQEMSKSDSTSVEEKADDMPKTVVEVLTCPVCQESFSNKNPSQFQDHVDEHFPDRLRCPICDREFAPENSVVYQNHVHGHFSPDGDDFSLIGDFTDDYDDNARPRAPRSSTTAGNYATRFHQWLQNID